LKISQLLARQEFKLLTKPAYDDREIRGCYTGDLLSWVMSRANADDAWITVQTNVNVVAVAALTDVACVIFPDGITAEASVTEKADEKGIVLLSAAPDAYRVAVTLSGML
jgi:predicted transcriptional regulator